MKAILIDTPNHQVIEVEYSGDYKQIYEHIRAEMFEVVVMNVVDDIDVTVFVDEEGLINGNPHGFFGLLGINQPLAGYGLVLGCDAMGETVDAPVDIDWVRERVRFLSEKKKEAA